MFIKYLTISPLIALSLGFYFSFNSPVYAQQVKQQTEITCAASKCVSNWKDILPELVLSKVIYLGEIHDSVSDHEKQLEIIQELYKKNPKIAIGLEMFQRPFQGVVNDYINGKISEAEFLQKTEYEKRWGFPWDLYAPILRFAREKKIPVLALNTPAEVTRKVSRQGLQSLTPQERKLIPPFSEIRTDNQEYRKMILEAFEQHQSQGNGKRAIADNFFLAQVLWDETMADTIAKYVKSKPDHQVIVLAGMGHIVYGYGIPSRVERRLKGENFANFTQRSVLLSSPEISKPQNKPVADFIIKDK
jgi:uncharacterized iron-regulated protein